MTLLYDYLCAIWMLVGSMFGMLLIAGCVKAIVNTIRRK